MLRRTETCRSVFNVLMCKFYKFYICAVVGTIIGQLVKSPVLSSIQIAVDGGEIQF